MPEPPLLTVPLWSVVADWEAPWDLTIVFIGDVVDLVSAAGLLGSAGLVDMVGLTVAGK